MDIAIGQTLQAVVNIHIDGVGHGYSSTRCVSVTDYTCLST